MKILIQAPPHPRHLSVAAGWLNAMRSAGHEALLWDPAAVPAFDAFDAARPDLLVETRGRGRGEERALAAYPRCRVVDRREFEPAFDAVRFRPGTARPEYEADVVFVGGRRTDNEAVLDECIGPLLADRSIRVRLHGPAPWGGVAFAGRVGDAALPDVYASAKVCLNVSAGRASERAYQVAGLGGCLATNRLAGAGETPQPTVGEFLADVRELLDSPGLRAIRASVHSHHIRHLHTYHHRAAEMFREAGLAGESERMLSHVAR